MYHDVNNKAFEFEMKIRKDAKKILNILIWRSNKYFILVKHKCSIHPDQVYL